MTFVNLSIYYNYISRLPHSLSQRETKYQILKCNSLANWDVDELCLYLCISFSFSLLYVSPSITPSYATREKLLLFLLTNNVRQKSKNVTKNIIFLILCYNQFNKKRMMIINFSNLEGVHGQPSTPRAVPDNKWKRADIVSHTLQRTRVREAKTINTRVYTHMHTHVRHLERPVCGPSEASSANTPQTMSTHTLFEAACLLTSLRTKQQSYCSAVYWVDKYIKLLSTRPFQYFSLRIIVVGLRNFFKIIFVETIVVEFPAYCICQRV